MIRWELHDHWVLTQGLETVGQVDAIFRGNVDTFWFLWGSVAGCIEVTGSSTRPLLCSKEKKAPSDLLSFFGPPGGWSWCVVLLWSSYHHVLHCYGGGHHALVGVGTSESGWRSLHPPSYSLWLQTCIFQHIPIRCWDKVLIMYSVICNYYWGLCDGGDIGKLVSTDHCNRVMGKFVIRIEY